MFHFFCSRNRRKIPPRNRYFVGKVGEGGRRIGKCGRRLESKKVLLLSAVRKRRKITGNEILIRKKRREIAVSLSYGPIFLYPFMAVVVVSPDLAYKKILPPPPLYHQRVFNYIPPFMKEQKGADASRNFRPTYGLPEKGGKLFFPLLLLPSSPSLFSSTPQFCFTIVC